MSVKTRLRQRKAWFTLKQAAQRLSDEFNEDVSVEDILELVVEGEFGVSVHIDSAQKALRIHYPKANEEVSCIISPGTYQISKLSPHVKTHLRRMSGINGIGNSNLLLWSIFKADTDDGKKRYFNLLSPKDELLPFPSADKLLIRRTDLDIFILSLDESANQRHGSEEKPSALLAVAALIELLKKDKSNRTQASIIDELQDIAPKGLSKGNMDKMLPEANRLLKEAKNSQPSKFQ